MQTDTYGEAIVHFAAAVIIQENCVTISAN